MKVGIIDYGMGNLSSVFNAFDAIGSDASIIREPSGLKHVDAIVMPGVGAFGKGIENLQKYGYIDSLNKEVIDKGKPFLGICLGLQLLATISYENGSHVGLNWISGEVQRINDSVGALELRIPHIGWNDVHVKKKEGLYKGFSDSETFYFIHSYHFIPGDEEVISGVSEYGGDIVSSVESDNIFATQFHPEKSHIKGLKLLENFIDKGKIIIA